MRKACDWALDRIQGPTSRPWAVTRDLVFSVSGLLFLQSRLGHVLEPARSIEGLLLDPRHLSDDHFGRGPRPIDIARVRLPELRHEIHQRIEEPLLKDAFVMDRPHIAFPAASSARGMTPGANTRSTTTWVKISAPAGVGAGNA